MKRVEEILIYKFKLATNETNVKLTMASAVSTYLDGNLIQKLGYSTSENSSPLPSVGIATMSMPMMSDDE